MFRSDAKIVLMTRPKDSSDRFIADLAKSAAPFQPIFSPAFENISTQADIPEFEGAVFTSQAGVSFAPTGQNRLAYCVGDATAEAATRAGYRAISSDGAASDLIALILARLPSEKLLHIRGEVSVGNVSAMLNDGQINCAEIVAYRKGPVPPTVEALTVISSGQELILPLFSAETVSILATWPCDFSQAHIVAMSDAIAHEATRLFPQSIVISHRPDQPSMAAQTVALIA